ncbi:TSUP family transporter [Pedomonas sp. V897]|uniref:TSUP family transporter n=1 Tax=Pedomonas sp. V897 TaxID=3446482 RepID=UPI003EDEDA10
MELAPDIVGLLCLAALVAGFIDAIAGGGGLITIPALMAAGLDPVTAIATNKAQACVGTTSATWSYWRAGRIDFRSIRLSLFTTLIGSVLGGIAVMHADTRWLMVVLPVLMVGIAFYFLFGPKASDEDSQARLSPPAYALVAGGLGFYDGFFGPGTGSFFALSLVTLVGMGLIRATAHTKALNLTSNIASVVVLGASGHILWGLAACMAVGQFFGGRLGARSAMRFGPQLVRWLLVIISLAMVAKLLSDPANPLRELVAGWLG